jgi:hypothetical protein
LLVTSRIEWKGLSAVVEKTGETTEARNVRMRDRQRNFIVRILLLTEV